MRGVVLGDRFAIDDADGRPGPRLRRASVLRRWPLPLAGLVVVAGCVVAAVSLPWDDEGAPVAADAPVPVAALVPAWLDIVKPVEMFGVSAPDFDKLPHSYVARRHRAGGGRQDYLSLGTPDGIGPYLRLAIYRIGSEAAADVPLFVDVARRAADASLGIRRSGTPYQVATRFGRFEAMDLDLDSPMVPACTGFRLRLSNPSLHMAGLVCGTPQKPLTRTALTCLLDRIDLNSAGEDSALAQFFATSELARNPACAGAAMAPTPLHAPWLDDKPTPTTSRHAIVKTSVKAQLNQTAPKPL